MVRPAPGKSDKRQIAELSVPHDRPAAEEARGAEGEATVRSIKRLFDVFCLSNSSVDDPAHVGYTRVGAVNGNDAGLGRVGESQMRQALVALHDQVLGD